MGRPKINHLTLAEKKRKRFIDDQRNRLYKHFVSIVEKFKPQYFVMENVLGIVTKEGNIGATISGPLDRTMSSVIVFD